MRVGHMSRDQRHADRRQRLGQSHESQREGIAREVVNLPSYDRALDLNTQGQREQREDVAPEIGQAKRCERVGNVAGLGISHVAKLAAWVNDAPRFAHSS